MGVVSYAETGTREIELNTYGYDNFKTKVEGLVLDPEDKMTAIGTGLQYADKMLSDTLGARTTALKLVIVTTDGQANRGARPIPVADEMKSRNINFVSIGIGHELLNNQDEIKAIASLPKMYYYLKEFTDLAKTEFLVNVTKSVCKGKKYFCLFHVSNLNCKHDFSHGDFL